MGSEFRSVFSAAVAAAVMCALAPAAYAGTQCGKAAWYDLSGKTASGEAASGRTMTAAHRTLPFGTKVKVENLSNGKAVIVRINDRGPYGGGRVIDLSKAAADKLGYIRAGTANVRVSVVEGDPSDLSGNCGTPSKKPVVEASLSTDDVPAPRPRPRTAIADAPADALDAPLTDGEQAVTREADAATSAGEPEATPISRAKTARRLLARTTPPPAPPRGSGLAQRFKDAFAPSESLLIDSMALGYAPAEGR